MAGCLCDSCSALCCRYFALPIDNPDTKKDFDNIRWYLIHENVVIFVEKKQWYIGVMNRCKHLQPDNRCGIYETRPKICRSYSTDNCDYHGGNYNYEHLFTSADALWEYAIKWLREDRAARCKKNARSKAKSKTVKKTKRRSARPTLRFLGRDAKPSAHANGRTIQLPLLRS